MEKQPELIDVPENKAPVFPHGFYIGKPRPNYRSPEVVALAVNKAMPEIMSWGEFDDSEAAEVAKQVLGAVTGESDGYERAKHLDDRHSWDVDAELVEILGGIDFYSELTEAVKAWIRDNSIKPRFGVGSHVMVKERRDHDLHQGTILRVLDDGNYVVNVPSLGHVMPGNLGTTGLYLEWEKVEEWNSTESV